MPTSPRVSIGMPIRDGEAFLDEALQCLLGQTYSDFELLISDNDSSDKTEEICRDHARRDKRIRYHRQAQNVGAVGNFNYVFQHTSGEYFKWASCDDLCAPTFLQRCVETLDDSADAAWCHSESDMVDVDGRTWIDRMPEDDEEVEVDVHGNRSWRGHPRAHLDHDRPSRRYAGVLLGTRWSVDSYGLMRRSALNRTRLLVNLYGCEKVLIGELSLIGKMAWISAPLFSQRIHSGASSFLDSAAAQAEFISARGKKPFVSTRQAILRAHLGAIRHASLSARERAACYRTLVRYVCQVSKWKRVLGSTLRGQSVGGGGKRIIQQTTS